MKNIIDSEHATILRDCFGIKVNRNFIVGTTAWIMPKPFYYFHWVSVKEGIDTDTYMSYIGGDVDSEISKKCCKCCVLFYIKRNLNKDKKICDICYDILADDHESGQIYIVWTDNQKFRVFTNLYWGCVQTLINKEKPEDRCGYVDLHKYKGLYSFWYQGEPLSYIVLAELN